MRAMLAELRRRTELADATRAPAGPTSAAAPIGKPGQLAYALGYLVGEDLADQGIALDATMMASGASDGVNRRPPKIDAASLRALLLEVKRKVSKTEKINRADASASQLQSLPNDPTKPFFEENGKREDVVTRDSGLQYRVVRSGTGRVPGDNDQVFLHYRGSFLNGNQFTHSGVRQDASAEYKVGDMYPGLRESVKLMSEGSQIEVFIPAYLGPPVKRGNPLGGKALVYELELLAVKVAQPETDGATASAAQ
jgi:FKBP-type peptidyl-prolyl cis-trans isomerase